MPTFFAEVIRVERIARETTLTLCRDKTTVPAVQAEQRQDVEQVNVFTVHRILRRAGLARRSGAIGNFIPAANKLVDLLFSPACSQAALIEIA